MKYFLILLIVGGRLGYSQSNSKWKPSIICMQQQVNIVGKAFLKGHKVVEGGKTFFIYTPSKPGNESEHMSYSS